MPRVALEVIERAEAQKVNCADESALVIRARESSCCFHVGDEREEIRLQCHERLL